MSCVTYMSNVNRCINTCNILLLPPVCIPCSFQLYPQIGEVGCTKFAESESALYTRACVCVQAQKKKGCWSGNSSSLHSLLYFKDLALAHIMNCAELFVSTRAELFDVHWCQFTAQAPSAMATSVGTMLQVQHGVEMCRTSTVRCSWFVFWIMYTWHRVHMCVCVCCASSCHSVTCFTTLTCFRPKLTAQWCPHLKDGHKRAKNLKLESYSTYIYMPFPFDHLLKPCACHLNYNELHLTPAEPPIAGLE